MFPAAADLRQTSEHVVGIMHLAAVTVTVSLQPTENVIGKLLDASCCVLPLCQLVRPIVDISYRVSVSIGCCTYISRMVVAVKFSCAVCKGNGFHPSPQICGIGSLISVSIGQTGQVSHGIVLVFLQHLSTCRYHDASATQVICDIHGSVTISFFYKISHPVILCAIHQLVLRRKNACVSSLAVIVIPEAFCRIPACLQFIRIDL